MTERAQQIARAYQRKYEALWNLSGADALAQLYTSDAVFTARKVATGRAEIAAELNAMLQRGWTAISVNILHVREAAGVVLVVSEFTAFGSGAIEGETLSGKSNHVLAEVDGAWLSAMHGVM